MKLLLGCLLSVVLSGCIPIGVQGRTSVLGAPGCTAGACTATSADGSDARRVSG